MRHQKLIKIITIASLAVTPILVATTTTSVAKSENAGGNGGGNGGGNSGGNGGGNSGGNGGGHGGGNGGKTGNNVNMSSSDILSKSNSNKFDSNVRAKGLQSLKFLDAGKSAGNSFDKRLSATVRFISRFDENGDGSVTREETRNLATRKFQELNADGIGGITNSDLISVLSESFALETSVIFSAMDKNGDGKLSSGESFNTHNSLISNGADKDSDGRISLQEYNEYNLALSIEATMAALDENNDGEISSGEFVDSALEETQAVDTNEDGIVDTTDI